MLFHLHGHGGHLHEHDRPIPLTENILWQMDHIALLSVGIDIGSAGTQVIFSRLQLERAGERLSSRYEVIERTILYTSPVVWTPYKNAEEIDERVLETYIDTAYQEAGLRPEDVHTGVVLLTGEAMRRRNAETIANMIAKKGGNFVCAAAGHHMEAMLAAHGSGAVQRSAQQNNKILLVDIGGGTTKLAFIENGVVQETCALELGGRLLVLDEQNQIVRLDAAGAKLASYLGYSWEKGMVITEQEQRELGQWMCAALREVIAGKSLSASVRSLFVTNIPTIQSFHSVMFSGGVGEFVYQREKRTFSDIGYAFGTAISTMLQEEAWVVEQAGECIRATVIGASQYTVQMSGNTYFVSDPTLLPCNGVQVILSSVPFLDIVDAQMVATCILRQLDRFATKKQIALAFQWSGIPTYERVYNLAKGIAHAIEGRCAPLFVLIDGDIARTLGLILQQELQLQIPMVILDGIVVASFDYIDFGEIVTPSQTIPVTVKSLLFN